MSEESPDAPAPVPAAIVCVDDEPNILSSLKRLFRANGLEVRTAESGAAGLALLQERPADLVISDMRMPEMDGASFLEKVRQQWPDTMRLLLTGYSDVDSIIGAINRGEIYRYITKPWDDHEILLTVRQALERRDLEQEKRRLEALTAAQNEELKALNASLEIKVQERTAELRVANAALEGANEKLKNNYITLIKVFSALIELRGGNLAGHSRRVADLCRRIAQALQLDAKLVHEVFIAGLMHEIGKVGFSDKLLATPVALLKPGQLDAYRKHILQAEQLLMPLQDLRGACDIIGAQFERFDGRGYPEHIANQVIPIGARILAVASDYDNLQTGTLSQRQMSPAEAKIKIVEGRGTRYDPAVVDAFVVLMGGSAYEEQGRPRMGERHILARSLKAGMVLSRDLVTPSGLLMLSADYMMDGHLVDKIADFEKSTGVELKAWVRIDRDH